VQKREQQVQYFKHTNENIQQVNEISVDHATRIDSLEPSDLDYYLDSAKPTGRKIKGYDIYLDDDDAPHVLTYLVKDPSNDGFLGLFQLTLHGDFYYSQVTFTPELQGEGIAHNLYAMVVKKDNLTIASDRVQTMGSKKLWEKLSKVPGIFVYAWESSFGGKNRFFQWDPDLDPETEVYFDEYKVNQFHTQYKNSKQKIDQAFRLNKITKEEHIDAHKRLNQEYEDMKDELKNRSSNVRLVATYKK
jgi:hypothetical protein